MESQAATKFTTATASGNVIYVDETLLRSTGAELKIMQELLRHSTIRVTLDTYTQAVTTEKRTARQAVVALLFPQKTPQ